MAGESQAVPNNTPDPTVLTTEQLLREISSLNDLFKAEILALSDFSNEKFQSIKNELQLVERQRVEQKKDTKDAVDAALCVVATTPILCYDLIWRNAGELFIGQELIAFEEFAIGDKGRRYKKAIVTGNNLEEAETLLVTTSNGTYQCTIRHKVLTRRKKGGRKWEWLPASDLYKGHELYKPLDVWEVERSYEAGWLAGILDGEGCLTVRSEGGARISIGQVSGVIADKIDEILFNKIENLGIHTRAATSNVQAQQRWQIDTFAEIMNLLGSIRPERLLIHSDKVWENRLIRGKNRTVDFISAKPMGKEIIASLSTSTGTYISGGFASKNTAQKEAVKEQTTATDKAIAKTEASTAEQLKQLSVTFTTQLTGVITSMNDIKDRITRLESGGLGSRQALGDMRSWIGISITILLAGLTIIGFIISKGSK